VDGNPSEVDQSSRVRTASINEVSRVTGSLAKTNQTEFINQVHKEFCRRKLLEFPRMCEIARVQNFLKWQELNAIGNKGKYTDSMGWSENHTMKFQFEIPQELYMFMQNLIYDKFWEQENKKIADKFMNRVCKGEDPERLLCWVRSFYGTDQGKVTSHGM
jgi:hypothetical protein